MSWIYLSHTLSNETPTYGGNSEVVVKQVSNMGCGDSCNASKIEISSHHGTHIDAPLHFDPEGKALNEYAAESWRVTRPYVLDVPIEQHDVLIGLEHIGEDRLNQVPSDCDGLLIRTGVEAWRKGDKNAYQRHGPGIGVDLAKWIRNRGRFKFVGFDFISASCFQFRDVGHEVHKILLGKRFSPNEPVMIIEDMALSGLRGKLTEFWVAPLMFEGADGAPVTVLAREE